jgi:hypothetical protein
MKGDALPVHLPADSVAAQRLRTARPELRNLCAPGLRNGVKSALFRVGTSIANVWFGSEWVPSRAQCVR